MLVLRPYHGPRNLAVPAVHPANKLPAGDCTTICHLAYQGPQIARTRSTVSAVNIAGIVAGNPGPRAQRI